MKPKAKSGKPKAVPKPRAAGAPVARAVASEMRRRTRRTWTIVEYSEANWTHGFCSGDRSGAWRTSGAGLTRVKPPAILEVPYAQFCVAGTRVLVESSMVNGSGQGEIFELRKAGRCAALVPTADGVKWRVGG
ncbi:MAG: hypothetical protein K8T20_17115 [Planctomycetes bacterium]|nr:hypothetical protein [Planctomycetota bacterium]